MKNWTMKTWMMVVMFYILGALCASSGWAADQTEKERRELYLKGNELWGQYCSDCHNAPPAADRSPYEWDIIALHMRTRANLPAEHVRAIFAYLRSH